MLGDIVGVDIEKDLLVGQSNNLIALKHLEDTTVIQPTTKVLQFSDGIFQKLCGKLGKISITIH